jgi:outer membrane protein OmpA-like peptidoglycan-associated protein
MNDYMNKTNKGRFKKQLWIIAFLTGCLFSLPAGGSAPKPPKDPAPSGAVLLPPGNRGPYKIVERSDWSRYDNGRYIGHVYREVRASILPGGNREARFEPAGSDTRWYRGNFFVLEETLRDMRQSARAVDAVIPVSFRISGKDRFDIEEDRGFPSLRGFPIFPDEPVPIGAKWTAPGSRAVDPRNEGRPVAVPLVAEYEYRGVELYQDTPVHRISAAYASRYQGPGPGFKQLQGTHQVDIFIRVSDGLPLLMRDNLDETYTWPDGSTLRFRGFTLTFGEGMVPLDRASLTVSIGQALAGDPAAKPSPAPGPSAGRDGGAAAGITEAGIAVEDVDGGVRLTLEDLRFYPDSDELLPAERPRLDRMARVLGQVSGRTFLVEGHTAAVGYAAGEMELSIQRAKRVADELIRRGIPPDRFIYRGWGGTKPLAGNSDEAGRARNRRVEITILE